MNVVILCIWGASWVMKKTAYKYGKYLH